jgi:hypothetical protein
MKRRRTALLLGLWLLPGLAQAQGQGQGRGNQGGNQSGTGLTLGTLEQSIVRAWLGQNPGFSAQPLPPGMRNRLAQGKPLPPGIQRRAVPQGLLGQLPPRPGYDYVIIGTSLVLMHLASGAVQSLLNDAFNR